MPMSDRDTRFLSACFAAVVLLALAAGSIGRAQSMRIENLSHFPRTTLEIAGAGPLHRFQVWVANTPARQQQGLMFVRDLPPDRGMLFPEPAPQVAYFWMENTYIPLDMLFVGENHRIEKIIARATPFSRAVLSSGQPVIAVIELKGGDAEALGIRVGDRVSWKLPKDLEVR